MIRRHQLFAALIAKAGFDPNGISSDLILRTPVSPPDYTTRGTNAVKLDLIVSYHEGQRHLPVIELRKAPEPA